MNYAEEIKAIFADFGASFQALLDAFYKWLLVFIENWLPGW